MNKAMNKNRWVNFLKTITLKKIHLKKYSGIHLIYNLKANITHINNNLNSLLVLYNQ